MRTGPRVGGWSAAGFLSSMTRHAHAGALYMTHTPYRLWHPLGRWTVVSHPIDGLELVGGSLGLWAVPTLLVHLL